ncbi:hypothetical protein GCM10012290_00730 [Halolactibacillus alkaliphilus]|uniref:DUF2877 domain-containing protein n=1 Tax=Halolactibacillus alkaliphilus TaxID=442899 RepID=A0A511WZ67_9BACI|nr:DUF2877 domain-containing protein [Halolactibacillus alkaliphilus]GEN55602.1 hypothetical protein HAL01_00660 [Halolactibacillus alkaliphilus]GGN63810.1 hypothetical protein GCM10012290_00730 [Halolactibacillus alkaliphilus]SFO62405.1 Protein of unknown function [Halolactibacillus alkaliphilus]
MVNNIKGGVISSLLLPLIHKIEIGQVHSLFKRGINIEFDDTHLFLSATTKPLSAFGINIAPNKLEDIKRYVKVGDLVVKKQHALVIYSESDIVAIHYDDLSVLDLSFPVVTCQKNAIQETMLYRVLEQSNLTEHIGLVMDDTTVEKIKQLTHLPKKDKHAQHALIDYFLGRGIGLTPSGDDLLMGYTMAVMAFSASSDWLGSLAYKVSENKTTYISIAYFHALLHDHLSENFVALVKLLDENNREMIDRVIKTIQNYGHTSGYDTLYGFWLGLTMVSKS